MTVLVGDSDSGAYTATDDTYDGGRLWVFSNTAVANGSAAKLYLYLAGFDAATGVKLCLHNTSGTLLAATAAITTGSPGWVSASITPAAITNGQDYFLGFVANGNIQPYNDGSTWASNWVTMDYASPGNFSPGSLANVNKGWCALYAETAAGGGPVTIALPSTGGAAVGTGARGTQIPNLSVPL